MASLGSDLAQAKCALGISQRPACQGPRDCVPVFEELRFRYHIEAVQGPNSRRLRSVWEISTEPQPSGNGSGPDHPAVMPIALARRCLQLTNARGGGVDPFAGSGTTLTAACEVGSRWVGIEINHGFVEVIESRLSA